MRAVLATLALLCLAAACSEPRSGTDGGVDGGADSGSAIRLDPDIPWLADGHPPIAPPDIPWLADGHPPIALTPCPAGWRELSPESSDGIATCDPYPESGASDCPAGQAHFPGEPACAPVGRACPPGNWPEGLPVSGVLYVDPSATPGGDGSLASPLASLSEAIDGATSGATIALAKGRYDSVVTPTGPVVIVGACAAETVIAPTSLGTAEAAIQVRDVGLVVLRDLAVADAPATGILIDGSAAELELDGVEVTSVSRYGIYAVGGAQLRAQDLVVRDTRAIADGTFGRALHLEGGASAELTRATFERNHVLALRAFGVGSELTLTDVTVRDTRSRDSDQLFGRGLLVAGGASCTGTRVVFDRNRDTCILADGAGTSLGLSDVVVRGTESRETDLMLGYGLVAQRGASAAVDRGLFDSNRFTAINASADATLLLEDIVVRDTRSQESDDAAGRGLNLVSGATAEVSRALFLRNRDVAVSVEGSDSSVHLTDVVVRATDSRLDGTTGRGLHLASGSTAEVRRALFDRNREVSLFASDEGTSLLAEDVAVRDTESRRIDDDAGRGLQVQGGASAQVSRAVFERNRDLAIIVGESGTTLRLEDLVVRDTMSRESDRGAGLGFALVRGGDAQIDRACFENNRVVGIYAGEASTLRIADVSVSDTQSRGDGRAGRGLSVEGGAQVEAARVLLDRNREISVFASGAGSALSLTDAVVRDTLFPFCVEVEMCTLPAVGIGAYNLASIDARRFLIDGSELCGVQVSNALGGAGSIDLHDGVVSHSDIGACIQVPDYDPSRLVDNVLFIENGINSQFTTLAVPDETGEIEP